ncbi:non-canonical purine NTP pyrophosphatase, partial [Campylobacter coli]
MKILLATSNKHKVIELKELLKEFEIYAFDEILTTFEIEENGNSFKENALIKARAVFNALDENQKNEFIVLSDDSGICVDVLGGKPGIYSARFSG